MTYTAVDTFGSTGLFDEPYFAGQNPGSSAGTSPPPATTTPASTSTLVPGQYDIAIGGRPFMVDLNHDLTGFRALYFRRESVPSIRQQSDTSNHPGEGSLNPDGAWRRAQETWHHGSGQTFLDRDQTLSDPLRFRTSKGVNVWTPYSLTLLPDTVSQYQTTATNVQVLGVGNYLYLIDGQTLKYSSSPLSATAGSFTWTTVTGTPAVNATSICTDGYNVWVAYGASGVYVTQAGTGTATQYVTTGTVSLVAYVKGRLMAANGASIYNITVQGALPTALYTQPNVGFTWTGFAEGPGFIYCAGYAGDRSAIYAMTVQPDGTALQVPKIAGAVPAGEQVVAVFGYEGFLAIGTNRGMHVGSLDSSGNVTVGALVPASNPVQAFAAYDRFVYYGLTNYDSGSTGIGRADLSVFVAPLAPASASDLMAAGQGIVAGIARYSTGLAFAVQGAGVFVQSTNLVPSGTLQTGNITFGLDDTKAALFADVRHLALPAGTSVTVLASADGATPVTTGISNKTGATAPSPFPVNLTGALFELTVQLSGSGSTGPTLNRLRLRATPQADRTFMYTVPLLIADKLVAPDGETEVQMDPLDAFNFLTDLQRTGALTTFQNQNVVHTVKVEDSNFVVYRRSERGFWSGTYTVMLKEFL